MGVDEDRGETIHYIHMNEIMPLMPMRSMVHKAALRVRRRKNSGVGVEKMNEMKTLPLAFTYVGVFLGAGFVSGPELWQFFGAFGNWGYVGFLLAAVLFTLFGILLVRLTQVAHTDEMDRLLVPWNIPWLRAASGIVAAAFLFGVVVIMAAGSGALLEQMTGLPTWIGNALFMLAVALVALLGVTGMVSAFSALIPVLVLATLAFAAAACIKFGTGNIFRLENVNTNPLMPTWLVASLTFVAYNLLGGIGIMAPIGKLVKKRSVIYWGITLAGVMLTVVAASILFSMAVYPAAIEAELPMVAVATAISPTLGTVYGIVLLLSMFCNALASLVAMLTYMEQKQAVFRKHKKLTLAAAAVLSWIGSLAGFGDLIGVIFPVFGYLSVVFLVCMMVHFIQCKRREKQSA